MEDTVGVTVPTVDRHRVDMDKLKEQATTSSNSNNNLRPTEAMTRVLRTVEALPSQLSKVNMGGRVNNKAMASMVSKPGMAKVPMSQVVMEASSMGNLATARPSRVL